jgi:Cu/Ag efflux pump CusA
VSERVPKRDGVRIGHAGQFEQEAEAGRRLLILGALVLLGVALIVSATVGSARATIITLANLPFALVGGVAGVFVSGGVLSVASMIGFITLFGIAMRNGILLVTRMRDLERAGRPIREAVVESARERLAAITMTSVTAAIGLLPLALALGRPGSEIQAPMAIVILCGLLASTVLNMLITPGAARPLRRPTECEVAFPAVSRGAPIRNPKRPFERSPCVYSRVSPGTGYRLNLRSFDGRPAPKGQSVRAAHPRGNRSSASSHDS